MRYNFIPNDLEVPFHLSPTPEQQELLNLCNHLSAISYERLTNYYAQTEGAIILHSQGEQGMDGLQHQSYEAVPMDRYISESHREGGQILSMTPSTPVHSVPRSVWTRHVSPPPRSLNNDISSASSAASPATELDWNLISQATDQRERNAGMEYYVHSPISFAASPPAYEPYATNFQTYALPQTSENSCVNMSQVQGIADPQEVTFEADKTYTANFNMEPEKRESHMEIGYSRSAHHEYNYHTDSAIGASVKDATSPEDTSIQVGDDALSDIDAEGESDGHESVEMEIDDPASEDEDYTPRTRTRKRASGISVALKPATKRSRITKSSSSSNKNSTKSLKCKSCNAAPFKDAHQLARHITSSHTRAFVCVFSFAGCGSTFASKNEWKRHVFTQHVTFSVYICTLGNCGISSLKSASPSPNNTPLAGAEFNRKDLFTQHLKRMHAPPSSSMGSKGNKKHVDDAFEKQIKALQVSALRTKRDPPRVLQCPVEACRKVFQGENCWDERMEHVAKHLAEAAQKKDGAGADVVDQGADSFLVEWALNEGIVERNNGGSGSGGYRLCVAGSGIGGSRKKVDVDVDVEVKDGFEGDFEGCDEDVDGDEDADGEFE